MESVLIRNNRFVSQKFDNQHSAIINVGRRGGGGSIEDGYN